MVRWSCPLSSRKADSSFGNLKAIVDLTWRSADEQRLCRPLDRSGWLGRPHRRQPQGSNSLPEDYTRRKPGRPHGWPFLGRRVHEKEPRGGLQTLGATATHGRDVYPQERVVPAGGRRSQGRGSGLATTLSLTKTIVAVSETIVTGAVTSIGRSPKVAPLPT